MRRLCVLMLLGFTTGTGTLATTALAASAGPPDPVASPLPPELAFTGGPVTITHLRGGGASMDLTRFRGGLSGEVRLAHGTVPHNDEVAEFTLFLPGNEHIYAGPVHLFRHGERLHIARRGTIMVDARGNTTQGVNSYRLSLTMNGVVTHGKAWITVRVGGATYHLFGRSH